MNYIPRVKVWKILAVAGMFGTVVEIGDEYISCLKGKPGRKLTMEYDCQSASLTPINYLAMIKVERDLVH